MSNTPVSQLNNRIDQQLRRIARLERALRDIQRTSLAPPHVYDYGYRARQIATDALAEEFTLDG